MAITVTYDGNALSPTPYVGRTLRSNIQGNHVVQEQNITLNGQISGDLHIARETILNIFSGDFRELSVIGGGNDFSGSNCIIESMDVSPSRISGLADYSVGIKYYDSDQFNTFSVQNPSNLWAYNENDDGIITLSHSISAEGLNISGENPFSEAKRFVESLSGLSTIVSGKFGRNILEGSWTFMDSRISSDNASARYELEETYKLSTSGETPLPYVAVYKVDIQSGIDLDYSTVNLSIEQQSTPGTSVTGHILSTGEVYNLANSLSSLELNQEFVSFDLTVNDPKASYSASFTDDDFITNFEYNQNISIDEISQISTVSIDGIIKSKGNLDQRWQNVSGYYNDVIETPSGLEVYMHELASAFYSEMTGSYSLRDKATRLTKDEDSYSAEIKLSAAFTDEDFVHGMLGSSYQIEKNFPMPIYKPRSSALVNGLHKVFDADINSRGETRIQTNLSSLSGLSSIKTEGDSLLTNLISNYTSSSNRVIENESEVNVTGQINSNGQNIGYSYEEDPILNSFII